jgi:hypothetical protein
LIVDGLWLIDRCPCGLASAAYGSAQDWSTVRWARPVRCVHDAKTPHGPTSRAGRRCAAAPAVRVHRNMARRLAGRAQGAHRPPDSKTSSPRFRAIAELRCLGKSGSWSSATDVVEGQPPGQNKTRLGDRDGRGGTRDDRALFTPRASGANAGLRSTEVTFVRARLLRVCRQRLPGASKRDGGTLTLWVGIERRSPGW